ncbi:YchJ family protein [Methylomonas sp. MgM2]
MTNIDSNKDFCICGSGLIRTDCCARYHADETPITAEQLMRSRFTAYADRNADYLLSTWDSAKRPTKLDFSKETAEWQRLEVINVKKGGANDSKGLVEFKAYFKQDGEDYYMHEISRFVKQGQRWLYLDGVVKATGKASTTSHTGRNALCSCGSGKKFKRCCGR